MYPKIFEVARFSQMRDIIRRHCIAVYHAVCEEWEWINVRRFAAYPVSDF